MLFDEGQCFVDHIEAGRAAHDAALSRLHDQPGRDKATQVEGERGGGCAKARLDFADGESLRPCPDKQADDFEAGGIPELGQSPRGGI